MARSTKQLGHVQIKAIFILLLLAGGEAVRVTDEVHWGKSEWNKLHADCTWSVNGCGEGCAWKRLPLDKTFSESCRHTDAYLLKHNGLENFQSMVKLFEQKSAKLAEKCQGAGVFNRKCKRREAQLLDAFKFIARAPTEASFMTKLTEGERIAVGEAFESSLKSLVASDENSDVISELLRKMKGHGPEVQRDPREAAGKLMELVARLLNGTPEESLGLKFLLGMFSASKISQERFQEDLGRRRRSKRCRQCQTACQRCLLMRRRAPVRRLLPWRRSLKNTLAPWPSTVCLALSSS